MTDAEILTWSRAPGPRLRIAARLARQIRDGTYGEWSVLPFASALAGECDVSASTVRRAQRRLADRGLIKRAGIFYFVAPGAADG